MKDNLISKLRIGFAALPLLAPILARGAGIPAVPDLGINDVGGVFCLFGRITDLAFAALMVVTIFFVVMAAYKYLTSSGDPEKVKEASHQILYAAIAIVVALLAKAVPSIVLSIVNSGATYTAGSCP